MHLGSSHIKRANSDSLGKTNIRVYRTAKQEIPFLLGDA